MKYFFVTSPVNLIWFSESDGASLLLYSFCELNALNLSATASQAFHLEKSNSIFS